MYKNTPPPVYNRENKERQKTLSMAGKHCIIDETMKGENGAEFDWIIETQKTCPETHDTSQYQRKAREP